MTADFFVFTADAMEGTSPRPLVLIAAKIATTALLHESFVTNVAWKEMGPRLTRAHFPFNCNCLLPVLTDS